MSEHLGSYELLSRLGAGGFGEVHLALDAAGRTVAVKVLHPHVAADAGALARLAREVETMRRVGGPHVAEVLDASLEGPRPYLVTRYVQGRPLSAVPVPVADLRGLAAGLADALLAMHEAGVVHRDLKPANVILTEGRPVVIDFGIASALDSLAVTASGAVVGTPGYLAPEVLEGRPAGMAADVFAFGATVAYAATGRHPYGQGPASAVAYRVVHHPPDLEGVPAWLEQLLRECLAADPEARPTAAQICARLGVAHVPAPPPRPAARVADDLATVEWRPGKERYRRSVEESRARHREKIRRWWVIGSGLFVSLLAAAAREPLPEVALFLLAAYALAVVADAGVALFSRRPFRRARLITDVAGVAGAVGLCFGLAAMFSTATLALFAGTALVVGIVFLLSA
ncbi:MAG TPA: serine/threonine-protein kinase [Nonomuraea sp.]|nr:serine/threonine-protein kinase [Nonomuraea sp.]